MADQPQNYYFDRIETSLAEINKSIRSLDDRLRASEMREAAATPQMQIRIETLINKIDEHEAVIKTLQGDLNVLKQMYNISRWIIGLVSGIIVALSAALATGKLAIIPR